MKNKILSLSLIILSICNISLFCFSPNVNAVTKGVKWYSRPITYYASNQLSATEINALKSAMAEWNSIGKGIFFVYGGQLGNNRIAYDSVNVVGKDSWANTSELARTHTMVPNGTDKIIEADIALNRNADFTNKEMKSIFMHELGHALGLAHNTLLTSIMHDGYTGRTIISDYDINDISTLY